MVMMYCPKCNSSNVELTEDSEVKDLDEWSWQDLSGWECKDCGCKFQKIETTEVKLEIGSD